MSAPPGVPLRRKPIGLVTNDEWMERIACRGSTVDFASDNEDEIRAAKRVCLVCPVRDECLDLGKRKRRSGVYGGVQLVVGRSVTP